MTWIQVSDGQVVAAAHMNTAIAQGAVPFDSATARTAAVPAPHTGMVSYLLDVKRLELYSAGQWRTVAATIYGEVTLAAPVNNLPSGGPSKASLTTGTNQTGGVVKSGGGLQVPVAGVYLIEAYCRRTSPSYQMAELAVGTASVQYSNSVQAVPLDSAVNSGSARISTSSTAQLAAGDIACLWTAASAANLPLAEAELNVTFLGPIL